MRAVLAVFLLGVAVTMSEGRAVAQPVNPTLASEVEARPASTVSPVRRALSIGAAIVPGLVVRGSGSLVSGDRESAIGLAKVAGVGLAALLVGGIPLAATYGSDRVTWGIPLVVGGTGLILASWFGDIWVAAGGGSPRPLTARPRVSVGLAPWLVRDPYTGTRAYALVDGAVTFGERTSVAPSLLIGTEHDEQRGQLDVTVQLAGALPGELATDHSRVAVRVGGKVHRHLVRNVSTVTGELAVSARLDGQRVSRALSGTFTDLEVGLGLQAATYSPGGTDVTDLLLTRLAAGAYLGAHGELSGFYDHRRDSLAGGLVAGRAAGFVGSFGVQSRVYVSQGFSVGGQLEIGSAWVMSLGLRYEGGS